MSARARPPRWKAWCETCGWRFVVENKQQAERLKIMHNAESCPRAEAKVGETNTISGPDLDPDFDTGGDEP